jgi:hypothetical protein
MCAGSVVVGVSSDGGAIGADRASLVTGLAIILVLLRRLPSEDAEDADKIIASLTEDDHAERYVDSM